MYNEQLEQLIEYALADGELTEKEKQVLFKKAKEMGVDLDEFEMVLGARLAEMKKKQTPPAPPVSSNKFGDMKKCPACGALVQAFQTKCTECAYEFRNVAAVTSAQRLFDLLQAAEMRKSEQIAAHNQEKARRLDVLSQRHNNEGTFTKLFAGESHARKQDEEREDLIRELNNNLAVIEKNAENEQMLIIKNFPVPNTAEDLIELLAMATSNAYDNDGVIGLKEETWLQKTDQIYQKIIACSANDKPLLKKATHMVASLMRRLPDQADYKRFTKIPLEMRKEVEEELKDERKRRNEAKIQILKSLAKTYGIVAASLLLIAIICFIIGGSAEPLGLICFLALIVTLLLTDKAWKKRKNDMII